MSTQSLHRCFFHFLHGEDHRSYRSFAYNAYTVAGGGVGVSISGFVSINNVHMRYEERSFATLLA